MVGGAVRGPEASAPRFEPLVHLLDHFGGIALFLRELTPTLVPGRQAHVSPRRSDVGSIPDGPGSASRDLAEAVRFELTNGCPLPVFKTGAIDHSATLPVREAGL